MNRTFIIAEAGVNHNGDRDLAFKLVDAAIGAGVDAVKFQTFKAENLVTKDASKACYQEQAMGSTETQFDMLKRLELSYDAHHDLIAYCKEKGIEFLSTAFDFDSLEFLVNRLGLQTLKIPSGEITNGPLVLAHARTGCNLIVSTGMATLGEVEEILGVIAFGLIQGNSSTVQPSYSAFQQAYFSAQGQQLLRNKVTLLHCTTEYPAPPEDINLNAMLTMGNAFGLKTGYSDHSKGLAVPIAAATLGATLIEKHFTLDKEMPGPDHKSSLDPDELKAMVIAIRTVEQIMGNGLKGPESSELKNRDVVRKSLVAANNINEDDLFSEENLSIKRPGTGRSPMEFWSLLGKKSHKKYSYDEVIDE